MHTAYQGHAKQRKLHVWQIVLALVVFAGLVVGPIVLSDPDMRESVANSINGN